MHANLQGTIPFLALCCTGGPLTAQNLVLDPGFELRSECPVQVSDLSSLVHWWAPSSATTDYYHACSTTFGTHVPFNMAGKQWPHGGEGYVGMITQANHLEYTELVQGRLAEPLRKGAYYRISYHIALAEVARVKDKRMGMCFLKDSTYSSTRNTPGCPKGQGVLSMNMPKAMDMDGWVLVSGMYKAKGGERFITIGNLLGSLGRKNQEKNKATRTAVKDVMGYYYLDDVVVEKARNRSDTAFNRAAADSRDELAASSPLLLAPCAALFKEGSSVFKDMKAALSAARLDTGAVPWPAMLEYMQDLLVREPNLSVEVIVEGAASMDSLQAFGIAHARAQAVKDRFLAGGARKNQLTASGIVGQLKDVPAPGTEDQDGRVFIRITGFASPPELATELE